MSQKLGFFNNPVRKDSFEFCIKFVVVPAKKNNDDNFFQPYQSPPSLVEKKQ